MWDVHEQVCVAAMDCGDMAVAEVSERREWGQGDAGHALDVCAPQSSLSRLKSQFPGSLRVQRLTGMMLEARGK